VALLSSAAKVQNTSADKSPSLGKSSNLGIKDALDKYIFPEIKRCVDRIGGCLDDEAKRKISRKVSERLYRWATEDKNLQLSKTALKLCCNNNLYADLKSNNGHLSKDFQTGLVDKCAELVGIYAKEAQNAQIRPVSSHPDRSESKEVEQHLSKPVIVLSDCTSDSGSDDIFHDASEVAHTNNAMGDRCYSSSPTTSFTVGSPTKDQQLVEDNSQKQHRRPSSSSLITTQRPAQNRRHIRPKKQSALIRLRSTPQMASAQQSATKASALAAAREVGELRLAGLDVKVPRPYLSKQARQDIKRGLRLAENEITQSELRQLLEGPVAHVGFCKEEVQYIKAATKQWYARNVATKSPNKDLQQRKPDLVDYIRNPSDKYKGAQLVRQRSVNDLRQYLNEAGKIRPYLSAEVQVEEVFRIEPSSIAQEHCATTSVRSILFSREMLRGSFRRGHRSPKSQVLTLMDDDIRREAEFTGFSGDIATITWLPGDRFICGAITHSDESNQQYNKPGNLVFGSTEQKIVRSVSGHRIRRPIVQKGSNSLASMRETQDPWLYCSVTSTAYDDRTKLCFTGSFDRTVKVWNVAADGSTMDLCGTWSHTGVVNFVVTSPHHGKVATAADVVQNAIRVYEIDETDISNSAFATYSGSRSDEQCLERHQSQESWAYYPATIQWGKAPNVAHLLLAGYSPRTFDVHQDVPEDKGNTGELCLWDTVTMARVPISSARTQNVFEVAWHPTRPIFLAATSATGDHEENVRTQLRLFSQSETGTFSHSKTFDCQALDINEISIMPNSATSCYVTASCTNGNTYVWDSAQDEDAIHILRHGPSIDDSAQDVSPEEVDSGVKFAAWGRTADRFYTGSSDGVVKAWNIRAPPGEEHVADVLTLSGGVSAGVFSDDHSRLLIGDATGKIHVLKTGDLEDTEEDRPKFRHRQPIIPHYEPSRPVVDEDCMELDAELTAAELAQKYVDAGQIVLHPDRYVGAIQGPNYSNTGLICRSLRKDDNSSCLDEMLHEQRQRYKVKTLAIPTLGGVEAASGGKHKQNWSKDLHCSDLTAQTARELEEDRMLDFGFEDENHFDYEPDVGQLAEVGGDGEGGAMEDLRLSGADGQQHYLSEFHPFLFALHCSSLVVMIFTGLFTIHRCLDVILPPCCSISTPK